MFSDYKVSCKPPDDPKYKALTAEQWKDMMAKYVTLALDVIRKIDKSLQ